MKMKPDPILEEIWRIKDELSARYGGDLKAMVADLRREQEASGRKVVRFPPRRPKRPIAPK